MRVKMPWRFTMFILLTLSVVPLLLVIPLFQAAMTGFDLAALAFLVSLIPLFDSDEHRMRQRARDNNVNRVAMLLITGIVSIVLLIAVGAELSQRGSGPTPLIIALILSTLAIAWTFSNMVYALHYAYLFYSRADGGEDEGGIDFPKPDDEPDRNPDFWDFTYFAFTLGMTFQTSDVDITSRGVRKVVTFHCLAAFIFNLGILAFTINVLGGS